MLRNGFWGREPDRNTCENLTKRTILFFAGNNGRYLFVADSMVLDRNPTISDQRIPL